MTTYYPKSKRRYSIPTKYVVPIAKRNDHEDRVSIAFASDYMPPIPAYIKGEEKRAAGVWKDASRWAFIRSILP